MKLGYLIRHGYNMIYIDVKYINITKIDNNETFTLLKLSKQENYISLSIIIKKETA
jgi:hypothetical protein